MNHSYKNNETKYKLVMNTKKYKYLEAFKNTVVSVVSSAFIVKLFIFPMRKDHIICLS